MGGYDSSLDDLKAFCLVVEGTNGLLEDALSGLHDDRVKLVEAEPDLREALAGLASQADVFQKETQSDEADAVAAIEKLAATARQILDVRLPALDGHVNDLCSQSDQATEVRVGALQADFDTISKDGFDALESALEGGKAQVDRWIEQSEDALNENQQSVQEAWQTLDHLGRTAADEMPKATESTVALHDQLAGWLGADIERMAGPLTEQLEKRAGDAAGAMAEWMGERKESLRAEAQAAHGMVEATVSGALPALEEAGSAASSTLDATGPVLQLADVEVGQVLADAAEWAASTAGIAALRPAVETADAEVTEIRTLMEALDQP